MTEVTKLKNQAKEIRNMILALGELIRISEMPIELSIKPIEGHKNLIAVFREIGGINLADYADLSENDYSKLSM